MHKICQDYHKHKFSINMNRKEKTGKSEKSGKWGEYIINVYNIIKISRIITKGKIFVTPNFIQWHFNWIQGTLEGYIWFKITMSLLINSW